MIKPKSIFETTEYKNPYFSVNKKKLLLQNSKRALEKDYYIINSNDYVVVILQSGKYILMTSQYRIPIGKYSNEFVGGFLEDNECPYDAAKRELKEETGFVAKNLILLGKVNPLISKSSTSGWIYYTDNADPGETDYDEMEQFVDLKNKWVKKKEISKMISFGDIIDTTTLAAWVLYKEIVK